ncbi:hypothetical protein [uncultured Cohaesibacter sp.]|uniref:hypothetical protein n=1 Tax=uncultured Cohaesibacter sp. TaxID=1002546 RepID=UPI0029C6DFE5|nr:hypothetical protein [uncultured Cohaesibacter sp.]
MSQLINRPSFRRTSDAPVETPDLSKLVGRRMVPVDHLSAGDPVRAEIVKALKERHERIKSRRFLTSFGDEFFVVREGGFFQIRQRRALVSRLWRRVVRGVKRLFHIGRAS